MQAFSDKIGNNQFATIKYACMDCGEELIATVTRVSETEMEIDNVIIGVRKSKVDLKDRYVFKCPRCFVQDQNFGTECDVYSRVVGFMRPLKYWNNAKQEEFKQRKVYVMPDKEIE